jgi:dihydrofolate synthase / folylpolyglutamate synthase
MLSTKDCEGFLRNFTGLARHLIAVPINNEKAVPAAELSGIARGIGIPSIAREDIGGALAAAADLALTPAPRVIITGSLYLAGEILALNGTPPE